MTGARLYVRVEETTWPINVGDTGWRLRYAATGVLPEVRLHAASIVSAYAHLTDPTITEKAAVAALRRARKAARA